MKTMQEVHISGRSLEQFAPYLGEEQLARVLAIADGFARQFERRAIWNINSTAVGGGVAEMLASLLNYTRGHGIDSRWGVMWGNDDFFRVTKQLHHVLHGSQGSGRSFTSDDRRVYEEVTQANAAELASRLCPGDVVLLHDPQTAGMAPALAKHDVTVLWRCHIGSDEWTPLVEQGWNFLLPYLQDVHGFVFSRRAYAPPVLPSERIHVIPPSIDAFSVKNKDMSDAQVRGILTHAGLIEGPMPAGARLDFARADGSPGRIERRAEITRVGSAPAYDRPLVVQVSRWDPLKDMLGVMHGFAHMLEQHAETSVELVLAGPNVTAVTDDPEGMLVYQDVLRAWHGLPPTTRDRVHLVMLPTDDVEENAAMVNALQRHATVIVQKSVREGFGLTVTEAMWKGRPVVASRIGGIQDQIVDGESGLLLDDPGDLSTFARLLHRVLTDRALAERLGTAARQRVTQTFLGVRHLLDYAALIANLDAERSRTGPFAGAGEDCARPL